MNYRVAIVGGGGIAESHLKNAFETDNLQPVAVAEVNPERAAQLAERYGITTYADYKEMIEREKPDIAVIALPHFLHKEAAVFCAEAGCHILLEKPMALNTRECDEIIAAVRKNGVQCMVGHTQHYFAENRRAKELIASGDLGPLVMANDVRHVFYYRPERPDWFLDKERAGGGILTNLGAHSVDKLQWMTGSPIAKVKARTGHFGPRGNVEGNGLVFLESEAGVPFVISQSGYPGAQRIETEFILQHGMLKVTGGSGLWISRGGAYEQVEGVVQEAPPFQLQFRDLIRSIETGDEPECSMEYARSVIAVIEAIYRSSETGEEQPVIR